MSVARSSATTIRRCFQKASSAASSAPYEKTSPGIFGSAEWGEDDEQTNALLRPAGAPGEGVLISRAQPLTTSFDSAVRASRSASSRMRS
jgi:hypothetical protein